MDMRTIGHLSHCNFVSIRVKAQLFGKLLAQIFRYLKLQRQFEAQFFVWPAPDEILKVLTTIVDRLFQSTSNEVAHERHHVKEDALTASVSTYEDMEAVKGHIHVA